jgi:hypothetical protein
MVEGDGIDPLNPCTEVMGEPRMLGMLNEFFRGLRGDEKIV